MGKLKNDLTNKKIGNWKVLKRDGSLNSHTAYLCKCKCGTLKRVDSVALKNKTSLSCGCLRKKQKLIDLTSKRFFRWTVIKLVSSGGCSKWLCKCDCGNEKIVCGTTLRAGISKSCGCYRTECLKKRVVSVETRQKIREANKGQGLGRKLPLKTRQKMSLSRLGEKTWNWKNEKAGYGAIHDWVRRHKGKPLFCIDCKKTNKETKLHWSNVDHKYKRRLTDYQSRCVKCHKKYDLENGLSNR